MMFLCQMLKHFHADSCYFSAAGYNNLEVAEYLLEHGADVNAQDKGGLIPLHNAASYGVSLLNKNANTIIIAYRSYEVSFTLAAGISKCEFITKFLKDIYCVGGFLPLFLTACGHCRPTD